jgi:2-polyprenyl-3-methyl-5-hydroxy-6-metoxy-1,4-benzoquinol methylase
MGAGMEQQRQTQDYFKSAAKGWQVSAVNAADEYSVIDGRNNAVLTVVDSMPAARTLLDVGCGTGQLVIAAAKRGLEADGIDFAEQMVEQCEANKSAAGVNAKFRCDSFFDATWPDEHYDVISAQGFIEYVSQDQMEVFFHRCHKMLKPGGALVVGSRNRLFNIVSMNDFTRAEMELGVLTSLMAEAIALQSSPTQEAAFGALRRFGRADAQPDRHPMTGIAVEVRYQYTPADLIWRLGRHGFGPRTLFPVHFHGLPGPMKTQHPAIHNQLAKLMGEIGAQEHRLVPFSSTFILDARKS